MPPKEDSFPSGKPHTVFFRERDVPDLVVAEFPTCVFPVDRPVERAPWVLKSRRESGGAKETAMYGRRVLVALAILVGAVTFFAGRALAADEWLPWPSTEDATVERLSQTLSVTSRSDLAGTINYSNFSKPDSIRIGVSSSYNGKIAVGDDTGGAFMNVSVGKNVAAAKMPWDMGAVGGELYVTTINAPSESIEISSIDFHGPTGWYRWVDFAPTAIEGETPKSPNGQTELGQNSPNPFNPTTRIPFQIAEAGHATLVVYDVAGREVRNLADGQFSAGTHTAMWDGTTAGGTPVPSGVYTARLVAGKTIATRSMLLVK